MSNQSSARSFVRQALLGHKYTHFLAAAIWTLDALACIAIIQRVPCKLKRHAYISNVADTEIDWKAYMEQVEIYLKGERDYTAIRGGTGPLVYPAAHVYVYTVLYYVTDRGVDIRRAQYIFAGVYLATQALVMIQYRRVKVTRQREMYIRTANSRKAPTFVYPLLMLSKRLHSIYLLRLFNDCWAVLFMMICINFVSVRRHIWASIFFSVSVATKMSSVLYFPAYLFLYAQRFTITCTYTIIAAMIQTQIVLGLPFLSTYPVAYVSRAFDLSRQFLFTWTVNWRFIGKDVFESWEFSLVLMAMHVFVIIVFANTRWNKLTGFNVFTVAWHFISVKQLPVAPVPRPDLLLEPRYFLIAITSCNLIGVAFARSLHYQFYCWFAWWTPLLLVDYPPGLVWATVFAQEWAWNTFPSTKLSSFVAFSLNVLILALVWLRETFDEPSRIMNNSSLMTDRKAE